MGISNMMAYPPPNSKRYSNTCGSPDLSVEGNRLNVLNNFKNTDIVLEKNFNPYLHLQDTNRSFSPISDPLHMGSFITIFEFIKIYRKNIVKRTKHERKANSSIEWKNKL